MKLEGGDAVTVKWGRGRSVGGLNGRGLHGRDVDGWGVIRLERCVRKPAQLQRYAVAWADSLVMQGRATHQRLPKGGCDLREGVRVLLGARGISRRGGVGAGARLIQAVLALAVLGAVGRAAC